MKAAVLTCLLVAWPLFAFAQAGNPAAGVTQTKTVTENREDPLQRWFSEQDRLLDDILLRLARIEVLVGDIHRLIARLPNPLQSAPAMPATPSGTHAPSASAPPASAGIAATAINWAPPLAGGGLLALLLFWWSRRRTAAQPAILARAPAVPSAPALTPPTQAPAPSVPVRPKLAPSLPTMPPSPARVSVSPMAMADPPGDQAIELAEIMLSMGLGHGAAQTLAEQIRHQPKQALRQWLKLLEIYRQNGQQSEFERSAEELRQHFNVQPEDWQARPDSYRSLEDYPHIAVRLTELWRKAACLNYLGNLLDDNRGGARAGFPQTVAEELLLLTAMLRADGIVAEAEAAIDAA